MALNKPLVQAQMPSNIALIKYMGKKNHNHPVNASLSYTLPELHTHVSLIEHERDELVTNATLKPGGMAKYLDHFIMLKKQFGISNHFQIHSANNFPAGCGLASSASSFAALTMATYKAAQLLHNTHCSTRELAELSRLGSGSSCRSFFSPYALWSTDSVAQVGQNWPLLHHEVLMFDDGHKQISSSQAHQRVQTSPLMPTRPASSEVRLQELMRAMNDQNWPLAYQLVRDEFIEMHELFHTSTPPFSYMPPKWKSIVSTCDALVAEGAPLLLTMDAGPNMHFLMPTDFKHTFQTCKHQFPGSWGTL